MPLRGVLGGPGLLPHGPRALLPQPPPLHAAGGRLVQASLLSTGRRRAGLLGPIPQGNFPACGRLPGPDLWGRLWLLRLDALPPPLPLPPLGASALLLLGGWGSASSRVSAACPWPLLSPFCLLPPMQSGAIRVNRTVLSRADTACQGHFRPPRRLPPRDSEDAAPRTALSLRPWGSLLPSARRRRCSPWLLEGPQGPVHGSDGLTFREVLELLSESAEALPVEGGGVLPAGHL